MNNKKKKITTTKIVLYIPYIMSIFLLYLVWYCLSKDLSYMYLTPIATIFGVVIVICGYITKWYLKKSALENMPKTRQGVIEDMLELQKNHPEYVIYDKVQLRQDVQDIVRPIKADEQKQYEKMTTDDVDNKIV